MSAEVGAWPRREAAAPASPRTRLPAEPIAYALSIFILLMATQPWVVIQFEQSQAEFGLGAGDVPAGLRRRIGLGAAAAWPRGLRPAARSRSWWR